MGKIILTTEEELEALIKKILHDALSPMMIGGGSAGVIPIPEIMNIQQASEFLSIAKQTIYHYTSTRTIPQFKRGKKLYFKKHELLEWLTKNKRKTIEEMVAEYESNRNQSKRRSR